VSVTTTKEDSVEKFRLHRWLCALIFAAGLGAPSSGDAFTTVGATLEDSQRWALDFGLADGIQVGIDPSIAMALGATTPQEEALVFAAIEAAFRAWESPTLQFDILIDSSVSIGKASGFEIDLFALDGGDPAFLGQTLFGYSVWDVQIYVDRTLSNGVRLNGQVITGADIYLNQSLLALLAPMLPDEATRLAALQRLLMHEIGHTIGLQHPGDSGNWDTDLDPINAIVIDPANPFLNLIISPNLPTDAIMTVRPCGGNLITCAPLFYTSLTNDEIGGRDALYPRAVPEPAILSLLAAALVSVARKVRRGPR
jgi:hypothetical protein